MDGRGELVSRVYRRVRRPIPLVAESDVDDRAPLEGGLTLVTGAASGIGRALAHEFARHGHDLVLVDVDEAGLEAVTDEIDTLAAGTVSLQLAIDLTTPGAVDDIETALAELEAPLEILVNNAGVPVYGPFSTTDGGAEREMIRLNVEALTRLSDGLLAGMLERERGIVVHTASLAGVVPVPTAAVYSGTKAYVYSFSLALAAELEGTGISVTTLCPGETDTGFMNRGGMDESAFTDGSDALMAPETVARAAYAGAMAGERVVVPGWRNRLRYHLARVLPTRVAMAISRRLWSGTR